MVIAVWQFCVSFLKFVRSEKGHKLKWSLFTLWIVYMCVAMSAIYLLHNQLINNSSFQYLERLGGVKMKSKHNLERPTLNHLRSREEEWVRREPKDSLTLFQNAVMSFDHKVQQVSNLYSHKEDHEITELVDIVEPKLSKPFRKQKRFYTPAFNQTTRRGPAPLPVILIEPQLSPIKGAYVNYTHTYRNIATSGSYFAYNHTYSIPCYVRDISLKYDPLCGDESLPAQSVRQILVVAVQRSGNSHVNMIVVNAGMF